MQFDYKKKAYRKGLKSYDIFCSRCNQNEARTWFKQNYPETTIADHKKARAIATEKIKKLKKQYNDLLDRGAKRLFGRKWQVYDYRVSGVGRDEFPESLKKSIRTTLDWLNHWESIWYAHNSALPAKHQSKVKP